MHLFLIFKKFIYLFFKRDGERERERVSKGGVEREGDRESEAGSVLIAETPMPGSNSRTVRSRPELKSDAQPTEPPRRLTLCIYF